MPRKRDGFVPLGDVAEAVALPGDRALTHSAASTRRHFTRLDQVNQLVGASEADAELGFMTRMLALCSLPRTNPGNRLQYVRRNGPYTLYMTATGSAKLPFGNLPRLLLAYVSTEAVRTQSPVLVLGDSLSAFMRKLGVYHNSAGRGGVQTRLRTAHRARRADRHHRRRRPPRVRHFRGAGRVRAGADPRTHPSLAHGRAIYRVWGLDRQNGNPGLSFSLARYVKSKHVRRIKVRPFTRVERDPLRATETGA